MNSVSRWPAPAEGTGAAPSTRDARQHEAINHEGKEAYEMGELKGAGTPRKRTVAVLGGGHGGHTLAADLTLSGHSVRFFEMERFRHQMEKVFATRTINAVGDDPAGNRPHRCRHQ